MKLAHIAIGSHNICITKMQPIVKDAVMDFCKTLMRVIIVDERGRKRHVVDSVYASSPVGRSEVRIHANLEEEFFAFLSNKLFRKENFDIEHTPWDGGVDVEHVLKDKREPRDYQVDLIDYIASEGKTKVVTLGTGGGKAQPLNAKVLTPSGWSTMGDLRVGTEVVTPDGDVAKVLGVYPQGVKDIYRVTFSDGRSAECCKEHLWLISISGGKWEVISLSDILYLMERDPMATVAIPLITPFQRPDDDYRSVVQRIKDTANALDINGNVTFATACEAYEFLETSRSIGQWATENVVDGKHVVNVRLQAAELAIASIEKVRKAEAQCISIDHRSHLYITDGYVVTHNTFCAVRAVHNLGKRLLITVPGRYVDKWVGDIESAYVLKKGDLMVLRGARDLKVALNLGLEGELKAKVIIVTSTTVQNYIKDHVQKTDKGYPIEPGQLCKTLGIGVRLVDECHQFFHLNFTMELYTHVSKLVNLSATLEHNDKFINRMLQIAYPYPVRMQGRAHKRYIDVAAISYHVEGKEKIPHTRRKMYSHTYFEESVMKRPDVIKQYIDFIVELTESSYIKKRKAGQKMLIFAATKLMCGCITAALKLKYPMISTARYVSEDDWKVLHSNEIVVTTLGSAGTAVDILDLRTVLMTVSVDSRQQNAQALGRLRELSNYDYENPEFLYIFSPDIEKHMLYHERKVGIFRPLCRTHNTYNSGFTLDCR